MIFQSFLSWHFKVLIPRLFLEYWNIHNQTIIDGGTGLQIPRSHFVCQILGLKLGDLTFETYDIHIGGYMITLAQRMRSVFIFSIASSMPNSQRNQETVWEKTQ